MKTLLKTVASELNVSKGKIKDMIRDKIIGYELVNGNYYVDIEEVREKLNSKSLSSHYFTLDKEMKYILKETLKDFKYTNVGQNHKLIKLLNKVYKFGYISNFDELEYLIGYFSKGLFKGYKHYPNEFVKWFDIQTPSDFYLLRNHYFKTNRDLSLYIEAFVMFDKLTNGNIKIICNETIQFEMIKDFHCKQSA